MDLVDTDNELMRRAGKGDTATYRLLVTRHLSRCVRFAERMLGSRQDAEYIVQDACLKLWRQAPSWEPKAQVSTWLYRVIVNACLNLKRAQRPLAEMELDTIADGRINAEQQYMQQQEKEQVAHMLQALPEKQRAALLLTYYEELSDRQAADTLGMSLGALQQALFRARQSLRHMMNDKGLEQKNGS